MEGFPDTIRFQDTGYFSKMMCDYLDRKPGLAEFYHNFPDFEGFGRQLKEKGQHYPVEFRKVLTSSLRKQYAGVEMTEATRNNVELLESNGDILTC